MPDLNGVTTFINSPPGQLVAGAALAGIVWKFFDKVEAVLTDQTKFEIAVWLVGVKVDQKVEPWPETFARVFDRVFGKEHLSWKCFARSSIASLAAIGLTIVVTYPHQGAWGAVLWRSMPFTILGVALLANIVPDYFSLLETRFILGRIKRPTSAWDVLLWLIIDLALAAYSAAISTQMGVSAFLSFTGVLYSGAPFAESLSLLKSPYLLNPLKVGLMWQVATKVVGVGPMWFYPAFFTSIWLWLYAGSGFLLKFARRFDLGFDWFNRKFDIEKKPLNAIGLVAGSLVAILYWTWAVFRHFHAA
jgi:hypothetical protein